MTWLDGALYPDGGPPESVTTLEERIDFLARLCGAWDFGILPRAETFDEVCRPEWRAAIERCALLTSPSYHLLRTIHQLPPAQFLGAVPARILDDECFQHV